MTSISAIKAIRTINQSRLQFVTPTAISQLFDLTKKNTVYKLLQRLEKYQLIQRLNHGQYLVANSSATDFTIANSLVTPSYISFETILREAGVIFQHYDTIFAVAKWPKTMTVDKHTFTFRKLKDAVLFNSTGVVNKDNYSVATTERAFLDMIYLY